MGRVTEREKERGTLPGNEIEEIKPSRKRITKTRKRRENESFIGTTPEIKDFVFVSGL